MTARTLGLDSKYEFVFRLLNDINESSGGAALNFEEFLKEVTVRIVSTFLYRAVPSARTVDVLTSPCWMFRPKVSLILTTSAISMTSCSTGSTMSN